MTVDTFPQDAATRRKGRPSIPELAEQCETPEQAATLIKMAYPEMSNDEAIQALRQARDQYWAMANQSRAEAKALNFMGKVAARDTAGGDNTPLVERLGRLASQGDREAEALLAHLNNPMQRARQFWLDRAVALDPYWETDGRVYKSKEGATYTKPDDLIDAYYDRDPEAAIRELPEPLAKELGEFFLRAQVEEYIEEQMEKRVAKGEAIKRTDENGETVYEFTEKGRERAILEDQI